MEPLELHAWHQSLNATFMDVAGREVVRHYGEPLKEYTALRSSVGMIDLSHRGRVCLTGEDRIRFLNGQVTNNIKALTPGQGCYAALLTAKGKMESDLHVYCLQDELLLDLEPGRTESVRMRLEKYIVADQVELADIAPSYGLLRLQGPKASDVMASMDLGTDLPDQAYASGVVFHPEHGESVVACRPRFGCPGFDLFLPLACLHPVVDRMREAVVAADGCVCGWDAMEMARVEAGIPRFGQDMDETTIPLEAGLEDRAVRYDKGCYIGQEVINRIHSVGRVTKHLYGLLLPRDLPHLPHKGDPLFHQEKSVGFVTSALKSPALNRPIALGYVRSEVARPGIRLVLATRTGNVEAELVDLPFQAH